MRRALIECRARSESKGANRDLYPLLIHEPSNESKRRLRRRSSFDVGEPVSLRKSRIDQVFVRGRHAIGHLRGPSNELAVPADGRGEGSEWVELQRGVPVDRAYKLRPDGAQTAVSWQQVANELVVTSSHVTKPVLADSECCWSTGLSGDQDGRSRNVLAIPDVNELRTEIAGCRADSTCRT